MWVSTTRGAGFDGAVPRVFSCARASAGRSWKVAAEGRDGARGFAEDVLGVILVSAAVAVAVARARRAAPGRAAWRARSPGSTPTREWR